VVGAVFGNAAELLAYNLEPPDGGWPADQADALLALRAEMEPWHIFVHLDDATAAGRGSTATMIPLLAVSRPMPGNPTT